MYGLDDDVRMQHSTYRISYLTDSILQLLDLVPRPVKALILLFPIRDELEKLRQAEEDQIKEKGQAPIDSTVFWIKQTVRPTRPLLVMR